MDFTCVEIKNVKYIRLINLDRKCEKDLDLTTIHREQELAFLNLYYVDEVKKKKLLKSIEINNIRPGKSGIPELHLSVQYDGSRYYKIVLRLNGYIYHNSVVDIRQFRRSTFPVFRVLGAGAAVIFIGFLAFFAVRTLTSSNVTPRNTIASKVETTAALSTGKATETVRENTQSTQTSSSATEGSTGNSSMDSVNSQSIPVVSEDSGSVPGVNIPEVNDISGDSQLPAEAVSEPETDSAKVQGSDTTHAADTVTVNEIKVEPKPEAQLLDEKAIVYFFPDSTVITPDAIAVLNKVLEILKANDHLDVEITGHCAFFGTEEGRQEISGERAQNVYDYFISHGWKPEMKPYLVGMGLKEIVTRDPDRQNLNRRVEIKIQSRQEE